MAKEISGSTCVVGSKLPTAIILRGHTWIEGVDDVMGGGKRVSRVSRQTGESFKLNGVRYPQLGEGEQPPYRVAFGVAYTPDIPTAFMNKWLEDNADHDAVRNHMIFVQKREADVVAEAKEHVAEKSGLEPLNTKGKGKDIDHRLDELKGIVTPDDSVKQSAE